ncbi:MFS transporter [Bacillus sp. V3-13]|uniref:MFS transporter n=1 Tax=Bacillus sp. V3-13 TaxID=2053728 RepID=UPI0015E134D2|nr:MFS transporter [Bacillus sp. V3-13]
MSTIERYDQASTLWRHSNFLKLWGSQTFNSLGQILLQVAVITEIYKLTQSISGAASVPAISAIASFIGSLTASFLIDRFSLVRLLFIIGLLRAGLTILLGSFLIYASKITVFPALSVLFILAFISSWYQPARFALLPFIVSRELYVKASASISLVQQSLFSIGWALGGILTITLSFSTIISFVIVAFGISGLFVLLVKTQANENKQNVGKQKPVPAWKQVVRSPIIRTITLMDCTEGLANAIWSSALLLAFTNVVLGLGNDWWGFINASYFIGAIIGSAIVLYQSKILERNIASVISLSSIIMGVLTFLFTVINIPIFSLVLCILMGPMYQIRDICQQTILQDVIKPEQIASIMAARDIILSPWNGLTILLMGVIADFTSIKFIFFLASFLYVVTAILVYIQPELRNYQFIEKKFFT